MSEELLINVTPQETRVATVENGLLTEIWIERVQKVCLVGTIFQGTVKRVLPGMEAAFIDIGLEKAAFLHVSDLVGAARLDEHGNRTTQPIARVLREGQALAVQVVKDPLGTKGARVSAVLTAPSRYLVLMPYEPTIGVSVRIEDEEERERLRSTVAGLREQGSAGHDLAAGFGYIVRTAAEGAEPEALAADMRYLEKVWARISEQRAKAAPGSVIFRDLPLVQRMLRDASRRGIERIRIDSRETFQRCKIFCDEYVPELAGCMEHYPGERPIFDLHGVEDEIGRALNRKVHLKSGGYLILDQTESMTTIDVNTGAFVGRRNLEETIFKTNLEAAQAIARQLRLRNLGGIIIIDFIDMTIEDHRRQVMRAFEKALERDPMRAQVSEVSSLGLVEMTRKRTRESLEQVLCAECPTCTGRGMIKTMDTVGFEITREIIRQVRQFEIESVTVLAAVEIVEWFTEERSDDLAELEVFVGVPIRVQGEQFYGREQYDVVLQ
jgi:ribonuclease G